MLMNTNKYHIPQRIILLLLLSVSTLALRAQNVTNAKCFQDGDKVVVTYHLDYKTDISLLLSQDRGLTFGAPLNNVSGDVGEKVKPGQKTIIYQPLLGLNEFVGDDFVFKVVAKRRRFNNQTFLLNTVSLQPFYSYKPTNSVFGFTYAINPYGKWYGWYFSATLTDNWPQDVNLYDDEYDDAIEMNINPPTLTDRVSIVHFSAATGFMFSVKNTVKIYAGLNCGGEQILAETDAGQLLALTETYFPLGFDAGLMLNVYGLTFSIGVASTTTWSFDVDCYTKIGIGFTTRSIRKPKLQIQ